MRRLILTGVVAFLASSALPASAADASVEQTTATKPLRFGIQIAGRFVCLNVPDARAYCMGGLQLGWAFRYGDLHIGFMGSDGQYNGVALGDGPRVNPFLAPFGGLELGTRYYTTPLNQHGVPVDLGIAARGSADFIGMFAYDPLAYERDFTFTNTYGPHFILTIGSRVAITLRAGLGWSVRKPIDPPAGLGATVYGLAVDGLLAALIRF